MTFRKLALTLLAAMPLGLVSFAAQSKLQDTIDQESVRALQSDIRLQRKFLFGTGATMSSVNEAYERFKFTKGLSAQTDAISEFLNLLEAMESKGMLQRQGEYLLARTPSQH